jgi:two-component system chemotaxis response regulator CheB
MLCASGDNLASPPAAKSPVRLLLVDDSVVIRTLVSSWIEAEPDLELAGVAADGAEAVRVLAGVQADICILDLEMPVMGGLDAIPRLLRLRPDLKVLVVSRLARDGGAATLRALEAGAADCLAKPAAGAQGGADAFRRQLLEKARTLARTSPAPAPQARGRKSSRPPRLRPLRDRFEPPELIAIAASTGGPTVLRQLLQGLPASLEQPIVMVQHMPAAFVELLAVQLSKVSPIPVAVACDGERLQRGRAWLAPGDHHLRIVRKGEQLIAQLDDGPPENFCRPAADVLFRSLAQACGRRSLAVVLTGMGRDGWAGASNIVRAGGNVIAQDEATSVVWGMPGAVVEAGLASVVGPAERLARAVAAIARGEAP